ncbi:MAG: hypothetical protein IANPNBLG_02789 [Bryobacteraceae bacterium]|nr:hypothetical protein [Bryobacteraceae bacterium]
MSLELCGVTAGYGARPVPRRISLSAAGGELPALPGNYSFLAIPFKVRINDLLSFDRQLEIVYIDRLEEEWMEKVLHR